MLKLLITAALKIEISRVIKTLELANKGSTSVCATYTGVVEYPEATLMLTGLGPVNSREKTAAILARFKPDLILNIGAAGSLSPDVKRGDVFIPSEFIDHNGQRIESGLAMREKLLRTAESCGLRLHAARLFTSPSSVSSKKSRQSIRIQFRAAAVDMEAYPQAALAESLKIPFASLKIITDTAEFPVLLRYLFSLPEVNRKLATILKSFLRT